jgi:hypothetical protein
VFDKTQTETIMKMGEKDTRRDGKPDRDKLGTRPPKWVAETEVGEAREGKPTPALALVKRQLP